MQIFSMTLVLRIDQFSVLSAENTKSTYAEFDDKSYSSLPLYYEAIKSFPMLSETEERTIASKIKMREQECKHLVEQLAFLFHEELLKSIPATVGRNTHTTIERLQDSFKMFYDLIEWEKKGKELTHTLQLKDVKSSAKLELEEQLTKAEREASKCLPEIRLGKEFINNTVRDMKKLFHCSCSRKLFQEIERKLKRILTNIDQCTREIRLLKNQLIQTNLRLVISIAKRYSNNGLALSDLIQEGNLGLIRAIDTYDYRKGHRFVTYATWWVKQAIIRALDCHSRMIRTPVYINERYQQVIKASKRLFQKTKREPTLEEIAQETNIPTASIEKVLLSFKDAVSLTALVEDKGESILPSAGDTSHTSPLKQVVNSHLSERIEELLSELTLREKEIIKLRFGIGKQYDHTLEEIGGEFNLSRERIRQILEEGLNKLHQSASSTILKEFLN